MSLKEKMQQSKVQAIDDLLNGKMLCSIIPYDNRSEITAFFFRPKSKNLVKMVITYKVSQSKEIRLKGLALDPYPPSTLFDDIQSDRPTGELALEDSPDYQTVMRWYHYFCKSEDELIALDASKQPKKVEE
jgi:hypothetical protein